MRKISFDEEELLVIAIMEPGDRKDTIDCLERIIPELRDDPDMESIVVSAAEKLKRISDDDFEALGLESYCEELMEEDLDEV